MTYAVNIGDMTRDTVLSRFLIGPMVSRDRSIIWAEGKGQASGMAVRLDEDEDRILGAVEIVRTRYGKEEFRFYKKTGNTWTRI